MEFGKVQDRRTLNQIDFSLPVEDPRSTARLSQAMTATTALTKEIQVFIGCPVWGKKEWVGSVYPPKTNPRDYLRFYSRQFNSIELNTTFYRIPDVATVQRWRSEVPPDFKFCPKFFQGISQFSDLKQIPELTRRFCDSIQHFESNLGLSFLQLPPLWGPDRLLILKRFFTLLPPKFQLAIEFRHPAWFSQGRLIEPAFDLLAAQGVATVITDAGGNREVAHSSLTRDLVMIRFLGNSLHPTDFSRIHAWVEKLGRWFELGMKKFYFFVHQPEEQGVFELIDPLVEALNQKYNLNIRGRDPGIAQPQIELFGS